MGAQVHGWMTVALQWEGGHAQKAVLRTCRSQELFTAGAVNSGSMDFKHGDAIGSA